MARPLNFKLHKTHADTIKYKLSMTANHNA